MQQGRHRVLRIHVVHHGFHCFVPKEEITVWLEPRGAEPHAVRAESEPSCGASAVSLVPFDAPQKSLKHERDYGGE